MKALGRDMILGPTVNINRTPLWGRNFEGYGEDPYLTSRLAVAYIKGAGRPLEELVHHEALIRFAGRISGSWKSRKIKAPCL